jgi:hypothetical protein
MRILLLVFGALGLLGTVYAVVTTLEMKDGTRAPGIIAMLALAAITTLAIGLYGVLGQVEDLRNELDALRAPRSTPEPKDAAPAAEDPAARATAEADREAAALMKTAEDRHFAKDWPAALEVYRDVVARFGDTKYAAKAKQQIANLASLA